MSWFLYLVLYLSQVIDITFSVLDLRVIDVYWCVVSTITFVCSSSYPYFHFHRISAYEYFASDAKMTNIFAVYLQASDYNGAHNFSFNFALSLLTVTTNVVVLCEYLSHEFPLSGTKRLLCCVVLCYTSMPTYIHTCMHACIHIYIHTYTHIFMHTYIQTYTNRLLYVF